MRIVAYIMAKNEESNIKNSVQSLMWCDEVVVADTGSSDRTKEIAQDLGAKIIQVPFTGFGQTRNSILEKIDADWIICFDADEVCTKELAAELKKEISEDKFQAFQAPRQTFLLGRVIKHSGWSPDIRHPVAFRKDNARYSQRNVHESLIINGKIKTLKNSFLHYSNKNLSSYITKSLRYAELGARELVQNKNKKITKSTALIHGFLRFLRHYIFKLGFLDGWPGLIIAVTSSYGTFIKYTLAIEYQKEVEKG